MNDTNDLMQIDWINDVINDPEFDKQDEGIRFATAKKYYDNAIDTPEFRAQTPEIRSAVTRKFYKTLQRKTPFSGRGEVENIVSAAAKTFITHPKNLLEMGKSVIKGATDWLPMVNPLINLDEIESYKTVEDVIKGKRPSLSSLVTEEQRPTKYGYRADGTEKGPGFLGEIQRPDGKVITELSVEVDVTVDGKDEKIYLPLLVPTLDESEIEYLKQGNSPTRPILEKAFAHAQKRWKEGKSAFATEEDTTVLGKGLQKYDQVIRAYERAFHSVTGDEIAETPEFAHMLGHMVGAALPISKIGTGIKIVSAAGLAKYGVPKFATETVGWGIGGAGYGLAVRGKDEDISWKEIIKEGLIWSGLHVTAVGAGILGKLGLATHRLAKTMPGTDKVAKLLESAEIVTAIAMKEGTSGALNTVKRAQAIYPLVQRGIAIKRMTEAQIEGGLDIAAGLEFGKRFTALTEVEQASIRDKVAKQFERNIAAGESLSGMSPLNVKAADVLLTKIAQERFGKPFNQLNSKERQFAINEYWPDPQNVELLNRVLKRTDDYTKMSYTERVAYLGDELNKLRALRTKTDQKLSNMAPESRPTILAGSTLTAEESKALSDAIREIQQKPMFQWTAEDKIFVNDFLQIDKPARPPSGFRSAKLPDPEPIVDTIAEAAKSREPEKSIFVPLSGMGARTAEAEAGLKKAKRKPRSDKGVPKKRVEIADDLKDVEAFKAEGEHFGTPFVRMKPRNGEQFPIPIFKDPVTGIEFEKSSTETLSQALKRGREEAGVNGKQPKGKSGENKRYPALEIDGEIYVASLPDGTNHGMVWDSLPEKIIEKAKKVTSGWANKDGSNFAKTHAGVLAGVDIEDDGTYSFNPTMALVGMTVGAGAARYSSKLKEVFGRFKQPKFMAGHLRKYLRKNGVTDDEVMAVLGGLGHDRKLLTRENILADIEANTTVFKDVELGVRTVDDTKLERLKQLINKNESNTITEAESRELQNLYDAAPTFNLGKETHFEQWSEPGYKEGSYREFFVTAPVSVKLPAEAAKATAAKLAKDLDEIIQALPKGLTRDRFKRTRSEFIASEDIGTDPRETLYYLLSIREANWLINNRYEFYRSLEDSVEGIQHGPRWQDGHVAYSEIENPIVRLRFNEREVGDERVLFLEEIQGPSEANQALMPEWLRKRIYDIGVKRALAYAKENGFDRIAWTTGKMQADRYNLAKHISEVSTQQIGGKYVVSAWDKHGNELPINNKAFSAEELANQVVGKELASKIIAFHKAHPNTGTTLPQSQFKGLDLEIGGEGLKRLYNEQIPGLFKKYGKGEVEEIAALSKAHYIVKDLNTTYRRYAVIDAKDVNESIRRSFEELGDAEFYAKTMNEHNIKKAGTPSIRITDKTPTTFNMYSMTGGLAGVDIDDEGNFTYDPYLGAAGLFAGMGFSKYALRNKLKPTPKRAANTGGKIASMYDETEKMIAEMEKRTFGSLWQKTQHAMFDTGWYSKNLARKVDKKLGMELAEFKSALGGATSRAVEQFKHWNKTIWGDLSAAEERILDRVINAERAFTIDEYKINITHQRGFTGREFKEDYLNHLQEIEDLNDKQVLKIMDAANKFFEAEHEQLKQLLEAKVISKKDYEHLSKYRYAPRYYIDYMATIEHGLSGRTLTLTETGIKDLESGATGLQDIRARRLLHYNIIKTQDTIAKARANGALLRLTDHIAERGGTIPSFLQFIRRAKVIGMENGKPKYEKPGRNQFTISTVVDGQRIDMIADKEFANSWLGSDPEIARIGTEFIRFCSGSQVVKTFATGINPSFIISNLPMDIGTVLTGGQYSWFLPYAGAQIAKDIAVVAKDAILRKGRFKEYIDEYGGMEFLSLYGRVGKEGGFWSKFEQIAGYPGLTSELMVRLAHRERALANYTKQFKKKHGRAPVGEELKNLQFRATQFARTRGPDYAQHGMLAKILDSGIPYFNANMQAGRVIAQNMKDHPGLFAGHMIQLAGLSALIYAYNKSINPEAVRQISPYDRAMYWTICLPDMPGLTSYTNRNNEKVYRYLRIRKVPALAALVSPVEALIRYVDTGDIPDKTLFAALEGQIPPHALPFFSALAAIAGNKDDFFWNDIWRGAQNIPGKDKYYPGETHPTFVKMGEALAELGIDEYNSPAQLQAAFHKLFSSSNPFVYGTLNGTDAVLELAGNAGIEPAKKTLNELLKNDPTWRRVFGETSPRNTNENRRFEEIDQEEGGIATRIRLEMDELTKDYIQDRTRENIERIRDFILKQHPLVQERLERRFMEAYELRDLPNLPFWLGIKRSLPVARARKLYEHVKNLPSKERPAFIKLANSVPGVVTEDVIQVWNELIADDSPTQ